VCFLQAEKKLTVAQRELEKARISADDAALRIQALQRQISVLEDNKYVRHRIIFHFNTSQMFDACFF
jgi:hypothetical protein